MLDFQVQIDGVLVALLAFGVQNEDSLVVELLLQLHLDDVVVDAQLLRVQPLLLELLLELLNCCHPYRGLLAL